MFVVATLFKKCHQANINCIKYADYYNRKKTVTPEETSILRELETAYQTLFDLIRDCDLTSQYYKYLLQRI